MPRRLRRSGGWFDEETSCARATHKLDDDVCNPRITATSTAHDPERDRWKVTGGADLHGDVLSVVVAIEANVIVVTLF